MSSQRSTTALGSSICNACRRQMQSSLSRRTFGTSASDNAPPPRARTSSIRQAADVDSQQTILDILNSKDDAQTLHYRAASDNLNDRILPQEPHRLHVYAHKHNMHITLVQPPRLASQTFSSTASGSGSSSSKNKMVDVLLSLSTGNIGFRRSNRSSYDAAFQLSAFFLKQIQEKGMLRDIKQMEVVLRGFGAGREAIQKALLGTEGRFVRDRITAVMDNTRLKFGGHRSRKPRRLG